AYRVLGSTPFCLAVLMLEVWNVSSEASAWEQTVREKNKSRASGGVLSAGLDLLIALEALAVKLSGTQSAIAFSRKTLITVSETQAKRWLGTSLGNILTKELTARLILQSLSGVALTGLNLYDAWSAWQWNDQATYGYLLISTGGLAGTLGTGFGGMAKLFKLNVLSWIALLLIGTGIGIVALLSATPMEFWLANGPFGQSNQTNHYLNDPLEAFYRLVNLLAGININISKNPNFDPRAAFDFHVEIPHAIRSSDTIIRLESRLPGLIDKLDGLNIQAECRLKHVTDVSSNDGMPYQTNTENALRPELPKAQRLYPEALELFFSTPANTALSTANTTHHFEWAVRAQFTLTRGAENRYFPAPPIKDETQFSEAWTKPDFNKVNQPFWADEITYKAEPND
ncbi:hypothetical protein RYC17_26680, partial [Pseudomonas syringae group sp. J248-6]|nr:hypothetical protein [Pseudomonas syringae group sp. J248-6]